MRKISGFVALFLACIISIGSLAPAIHIEKFSDDTKEKSIVIEDDEEYIKINLPMNSTVLNGTLSISPLMDKPLKKPEVDIGCDGSVDWSFETGRFGLQDSFIDGSLFKNVSPGNHTLQILLPCNSSITDFKVRIKGEGDVNDWWDMNWTYRIPVWINETSGIDQNTFLADLFISLKGANVSSAKDEIRIIDKDGNEVEHDVEIVYTNLKGDQWIRILFPVKNLKGNEKRLYHIYCGNPNAKEPNNLVHYNGNLVKNYYKNSKPFNEVSLDIITEMGIGLDTNGDVYAVDPFTCRVSSYYMSFGTPGSGEGQFSNPMDIAFSSNGTMYVVDLGNYRIQILDKDGNYLGQIGETGVRKNDTSHFLWPTYIHIDKNGDIYVSDGTRVMIFDSSLKFKKMLGEGMTPGADNYHFDGVGGVCTDSMGNIYVCDISNERVQIYDSNYTYIKTLGVTEVQGSDNSHFKGPIAVTVDSKGNIYVLDRGNGRIQVFDKEFNYIKTIGKGMTGYLEPLSFNNAADIECDGKDRLFVSEFGITSIHIIYPETGEAYLMGKENEITLVPKGNDENHFMRVVSVAVDNNGRIYASDRDNHRVLVLNFSGGAISQLGATGVPGNDLSHFNYPWGVDVDKNGRIYVADTGYIQSGLQGVVSNDRVLIFSRYDSNSANIILGTGDPQNDNMHLNMPYDVSVNSNGKIAVADTGYFGTIGFPDPPNYGNRVQIYNDLSDTIADATLGTAGSIGNDMSHFNRPRGIFYGGDKIYVADTLNHRVLIFFNTNDNIADDIIGSGSQGTGNYEFDHPQDVAVDSKGNIYVVDSGNSRIMVYDKWKTFIKMYGKTGEIGNDAAHFNEPIGIDLSKDDKIYVADSGNNRIVIINPVNVDVLELEKVSVPTNVKIDFNSDGKWDWVRSLFYGEEEIRPDYEFNLTHENLKDEYGNAFSIINITLHFENDGRINISVSISYNVKIFLNITNALKSVYDTSNGTILIGIRGESSGGIVIGDVNVYLDAPPCLISELNDVEMKEEEKKALIDAREFFEDDFSEEIKFKVVALSDSPVSFYFENSTLVGDATEALNWSGRVALKIKAEDSKRQTSESNIFEVNVKNVNDAPVITSIPNLTAEINKEYRYEVIAVDGDNDTLTYALIKKPMGMNINEDGAITWTPKNEQSGENYVVIEVFDGELSAYQNFTINVSAMPPAHPENKPPEFISKPFTLAYVNKKYEYDADAIDPDDDKITYSLGKHPKGMSIVSTTGLVEWFPTDNDVGIHTVEIKASDEYCTTVQSYNLTVKKEETGELNIIIENMKDGELIKGKFRLMGKIEPETIPIKSVKIKIDDGEWEDAQGKIAWLYEIDTTKLTDGWHEITIRVEDTLGRTSEVTLKFEVRNEPNAVAEIPIIYIIALIIIVGGIVTSAVMVVRRKKKCDKDSISPTQQMATIQSIPGIQHQQIELPPREIECSVILYHDGRLIYYASHDTTIDQDSLVMYIRRIIQNNRNTDEYLGRNILIERGPLVYMACTTKHPDHEKIRRKMRKFLTNVDEMFKGSLKRWDGDLSKVKGIRRMADEFMGMDVEVEMSREEKLKIIEERFLKGEISEETYKKLKKKYGEDIEEEEQVKQSDAERDEKMKRRLQKLDEMYRDGRISQKTYEQLRKKYSEK